MTPPPPPGQGPVSPPPPPPGMNAPGPMRGGPGMPPPGMYPPMPPMMMMPPPQRQGGGFAKAIFLTLATTIFGLSLVLNAYLIVAVTVSSSGGESSRLKADETPLKVNGGGDEKQKVAIVKLDGVITDSSVKPLIQLLDHIEADQDVKAMVLEVDSPGGAVTPSDQLYDRILRLKQDRKFPVYVSMDSLAASGGYYVSMAADKLYASETTMTGSIGVLFDRYDLSGFGDKYGIKEEPIVSDGATYKTSGSMFKPMSPDEISYFKGLLNDARDTFKDRIQKGRPKLTKQQIDAAANGKIYSAKQALALGLIDQIDYLDAAVADVAKAAGLTNPRAVRVERELTFAEKLFGSQASARAGVEPGAQVSVGGANVTIDRGMVDAFLRPRPMYLWQGQ